MYCTVLYQSRRSVDTMCPEVSERWLLLRERYSVCAEPSRYNQYCSYIIYNEDKQTIKSRETGLLTVCCSTRASAWQEYTLLITCACLTYACNDWTLLASPYGSTCTGLVHRQSQQSTVAVSTRQRKVTFSLALRNILATLSKTQSKKFGCNSVASGQTDIKN